MTEKEFRDKYYQLVKNQTIETLPKFIEGMMGENHNYGSVCCAVTAAALAAAWAANHHKNGGITGFQGGAIMWEFIQQWRYTNNKCGLKIINYDDMLYPQHGYKFTEKKISKDCWAGLQRLAKEKINEGHAVQSVLSHWGSIVDGVVPFGYSVKVEDE